MTLPKAGKGDDLETPPPLQKRPSLMNKLGSYFASLPRRQAASKVRAKSESDLRILRAKGSRRGSCQEEQPLLPRSIDIPTLSDEPCPYDPGVYYSFPSIEKARSPGLLCGLTDQCPWRTDTQSADSRRGSKGSITYPCISRTGSPCLHIASTDKQPRTPHSPHGFKLPTVEESISWKPASSAAGPSGHLEQLDEPSTPSAIAGLLNWTWGNRPPTRHGPVPESQRRSSLPQLPKLLKRLSQSSFGSRDSSTPTIPTSPRLHHVRLSPVDGHAYPYIPKRDVRHHLQALQAHGETITSSGDLQTGVSGPTDSRGRHSQDDPSTVLYPLPDPRGPSGTSSRTSTPSSLLQRGAGRKTGKGKGKCKATPEQVTRLPPTTISPRNNIASLTSQTGLRHLRRASLSRNLALDTGGDASAHTRRADSPSRMGSPPSTVPLISSPLALVETIQTSGSVTFDTGATNAGPTPISVNLHIGEGDVFQLRTTLSSGETHVASQEGTTTTLAYPDYPRRPAAPLFGRRENRAPLSTRASEVTLIGEVGDEDDDNSVVGEVGDGDDNSMTLVRPPFTSTASNTSSIVGGRRVELKGGGSNNASGSERGDSPVPRLRGGGGSDSSAWTRIFDDEDCLPRRLTWMAGVTVGRGAVTAGEWKRRKPKRRRGGLLGLVLHGRKAGEEYHKDAEDSEGSDGQTECGESGSTAAGNGAEVGSHAEAGGQAEATGEADATANGEDTAGGEGAEGAQNEDGGGGDAAA